MARDKRLISTLTFVKTIRMQSEMTAKSHPHTRASRWDWVGVSLSSVCVAHCLVLPLMMAVLPALHQFHSLHSSTGFHYSMAALILPVAFYAFRRGHRVHKKMYLVALGALGVTLLLVGVASTSFGWEIETPVSLVGSAILVFAHIRNWQLSRCPICHHD